MSGNHCPTFGRLSRLKLFMFLARSSSAVLASFLSCIQIKPAFHIPSESSTDFIFQIFFCPFSLIIIGKLGDNTQMLNFSLEIYVTSLIRKGRKLWINRTKHINNKYCWKKNLCNGWKCKLYPCMETTLEMRSRHTNIPTKSDQSADLNNKRCPKCRKRSQF